MDAVNVNELNLNDFKPKSEPPFDMGEEDFVKLETLLGKTIRISGVRKFESARGPGLFIRFNLEGEEKLHYTTTHAYGIMRILDNDDLIGFLDDGKTVKGTLVKRPSQKDPSKTVWELN